MYNLGMETIPSAEFRKRYASLRVPTIVTVNGHTIGTWTPAQPYELEVRYTSDRAERLAADRFGHPSPAPKRK